MRANRDIQFACGFLAVGLLVLLIFRRWATEEPMWPTRAVVGQYFVVGDSNPRPFTYRETASKFMSSQKRPSAMWHCPRTGKWIVAVDERLQLVSVGGYGLPAVETSKEYPPTITDDPTLGIGAGETKEVAIANAKGQGTKRLFWGGEFNPRWYAVPEGTLNLE